MKLLNAIERKASRINTVLCGQSLPNRLDWHWNFMLRNAVRTMVILMNAPGRLYNNNTGAQRTIPALQKQT